MVDITANTEKKNTEKNMGKSWDKVWEDIYTNQDWGKYPPEELIRFIARNFYAKPVRSDVKILDLGCGTGAATWYVAREGFTAFGIDGSASGIEKAKKRFAEEGLKGAFTVGDFISLPYPDGAEDAGFDAVIDICAVQHNSAENAEKIVAEALRVLTPGGKFFSMLISEESKFAAKDNPFEGKGLVTLYTKEGVKKLFAGEGFKNVVVDTSSYTDQGNFVSHFVVQAEK
jgi:SAM-dependent methyltransferase